ncbi:hypothetical protein BH20ACT3_BH20ACT3_17770 [soil metagenome]
MIPAGTTRHAPAPCPHVPSAGVAGPHDREM